MEVEEAAQARRVARRTQLDLAGFARGAMVDAALAALRASGVPAAHVGTAFQHAAYALAGEERWTAELPRRDDAEGGPLARVRWRSGGFSAVVRGRVTETRPPPGAKTNAPVSIHDRIDPRSGRPARGLLAAVVAADRASTANGYAEAVFVMGMEEGKSFLEARRDLRGALLSDTGGSWASDGTEIEWLH